jgi:hypothetical protein
VCEAWGAQLQAKVLDIPLPRSTAGDSGRPMWGAARTRKKWKLHPSPPSPGTTRLPPTELRFCKNKPGWPGPDANEVGAVRITQQNISNQRSAIIHQQSAISHQRHQQHLATLRGVPMHALCLDLGRAVRPHPGGGQPSVPGVHV